MSGLDDHSDIVLYQSSLAPFVRAARGRVALRVCLGPGLGICPLLFQQESHGRCASVFILTGTNRPDECAEKTQRDHDAQRNEEEDDAHRNLLRRTGQPSSLVLSFDRTIQTAETRQRPVSPATLRRRRTQYRHGHANKRQRKNEGHRFSFRQASFRPAHVAAPQANATTVTELTGIRIAHTTGESFPLAAIATPTRL